MIRQYTYIYMCLMAVLMLAASCSDDDSFTTSSANRLTFSVDTVKLDTTFSRVPTITKTFWVYNRSGAGIRCASVRQQRGNQSGFRVNVDGTYLGVSSGFQVHDVEIRNKDSIRVFVELTSTYNYQNEPQRLEDNLIFTLESGVQQTVNLSAYSWDATLLQNVTIDRDSTIASSKPIVIYGGMRVEPGVTLTIGAGTTLYFHADAGVDVFGTLRCEGTAEQNVVFRGDRIDRMFDYLPYDRVSGQWQGIHFYESSYGNELTYTDVHSAFDGIRCDSADVTRPKLLLSSSTVHNCQGYGLRAESCKMEIQNTQLSNTLGDCACFLGGDVTIDNCTLAQFYPFDVNRQAALSFSNAAYDLVQLTCRNSLITGYADDVLMATLAPEKAADYQFDHCIIRTPAITTDDSTHFSCVIYEDVKDTSAVTGVKHFVNIDISNLQYDFRLDSLSPAVGAADPHTAMPFDRNGVRRDEKPDIGAYERD